MKKIYLSPAVNVILLDSDNVLDTLGGGSQGGPGHGGGDHTDPFDIVLSKESNYNAFALDDDLEDDYEDYDY